MLWFLFYKTSFPWSLKPTYHIVHLYGKVPNTVFVKSISFFLVYFICSLFFVCVYNAATIFSEADGSIQSLRRLGKYGWPSHDFQNSQRDWSVFIFMSFWFGSLCCHLCLYLFLLYVCSFAVLLNNPPIFERIFSDEFIVGIIGALECKPILRKFISQLSEMTFSYLVIISCMYAYFSAAFFLK